MIAVVPGQGCDIDKFTLPGQAISASGYNPAVAANDFVLSGQAGLFGDLSDAHGLLSKHGAHLAELLAVEARLTAKIGA